MRPTRAPARMMRTSFQAHLINLRQRPARPPRGSNVMSRLFSLVARWQASRRRARLRSNSTNCKQRTFCDRVSNCMQYAKILASCDRSKHRVSHPMLWQSPQRTALRRFLTVFLALLFLPLGTANIWAQVACKPLLSIKSVRDVRASHAPASPWRWTAVVVGDARHCATRSGNFEIDFVRTKENAPDLQFTEKFRWQHDEFGIAMELTSDESVIDFRIGFIAPCVCRPIAELVSDPQPTLP